VVVVVVPGGGGEDWPIVIVTVDPGGDSLPIVVRQHSVDPPAVDAKVRLDVIGAAVLLDMDVPA